VEVENISNLVFAQKRAQYKALIGWRYDQLMAMEREMSGSDVEFTMLQGSRCSRKSRHDPQAAAPRLVMQRYLTSVPGVVSWGKSLS
jgi:hypothetical protein